MKINFSFMAEILRNPSFWIAYFATVIAWVAYRWQVIQKYHSIRDILISLREQLKFQGHWFGTSYTEPRIKRFFKVSDVVFKVDFPAVREIISKGHLASLKIDEIDIDKLIEELSIFNERIQAFNQMLDYLENMATSNQYIAQEAHNLVKDCGAFNDAVDIVQFMVNLENNPIYKYKNHIRNYIRQIECYNRILHHDLISSPQNEFGLYYLWQKISCKINLIIGMFNSEKLFPWYFRRYIFFPLLPALFFIILWLIILTIQSILGPFGTAAVEATQNFIIVF